MEQYSAPSSWRIEYYNILQYLYEQFVWNSQKVSIMKYLGILLIAPSNSGKDHNSWKHAAAVNSAQIQTLQKKYGV